MNGNIPPNALPIVINNFRTPASVWATEVVRDGMSEERHRLEIFERRLSSEINKNKKKGALPYRESNDVVAVQSLHDHRRWHRGRIECRMELQTGPRYRVLLVDQGITVRAKPEFLRCLPFKDEDLPYQAMILVLEGIVPLNLALSTDLESFQPEISEGWTPTAEKYVEDLKNSYSSAYFVEKDTPRHGQIRYGDILLRMTDNDAPTSLAELLCRGNFAKLNRSEFLRREQHNIETDGPEVSRLVSPLSYNCSTDTASSCCASPARSMMSSQKPDVSKQTISDYMQQVTRSPERNKAPTLEQSPKSSNDAEPILQASPQLKGRYLLLSQLQKNLSNSPVSNEQTPAPALVCSPHPAPTQAVEPSTKSPGLSPRSLEKDPAPRSLGACFIPAGRPVKKENKPTRAPSSSSSFIKSSDSEDSFSSRSKQSREMPEGPLIASQNASDHKDKLKVVYSSDSSFSDSNVQQKEPAPQASTFKSSSDQTGLDSSDSAPSGWSTSSAQSAPGRLSLLSILRKKGTATLPKTDESSGSESITGPAKVGPTGFMPARAPLPDAKVEPTGFMKNRLLSAPKIHPVVDDDILSETYLARSLLLHGGLPPKPWVVYNDLKLKFSSTVEKYLMDKKWCYNILNLEKYMWPAIQQRQNVVMISPKGSGKSTSYVVPIIDFMCCVEEMPKGVGPIALIICSGSQSASKIYEECVKLVRNMKKPPQVQVAYGLAVEQQFILKLLNGCEIFITTPPCLLRLLKNHSYAMSFHRLEHFILDEADILMSRFLKEVQEIQALVVAEQAIRTKDEKDPIQIVVASEKWEPHLLSFSHHLRGNPLLCINDSFEACVYGRPEVVFHLAHSDKKLSKLIKVLKELAGLQKVVVFCDESELSSVEGFIENACFNYSVLKPHTDTREMEGILSSWNSSRVGEHFILLCPDSELMDLKINNATSVVHYSLPSQDKSYFVKRLSVILGSLPNRIEEKTLKSNEKPDYLRPSVHLLMDQSNSEQLPVIVQLMERIAGKLDQKCLDVAQRISMIKEKKTKKDKLFCSNIKMFGHCLNGTDCRNRHVFVPEFDVSDTLPSTGIVSMHVTQVHCAGHYSVRLVEHIDVNRKKTQWPSEYLKIGLKMSAYFSKQDNRMNVAEINVGDLHAAETDDGLFQRVQVVEVVERDRHGNPSLIFVKYLDDGRYNSLKDYMLYHLPEDLKAFPAQVVDIFLCNLLPADQDSNYGADANAKVKKWMKPTNEDGKETLLQGQVMLSMTGCLWVDPVNILEWLPNTQEYVVRRNIKQSLLQGNFALPNDNHLSNLYSLCEKDPILYAPKTTAQCPIKSRVQPKPAWAFLESELWEEIEFISAESVSCFFVRRVKFQPLLDELIKEVQNIQRKSDEVSLLVSGNICLAKHDDEWHRVRITSLNDDLTFSVFYVDYGDSETVPLEGIKCIPDWAITKLPFQAIECSLVGVSSCNTVDKLYDLADGRSLVAKVWKKKAAKLTDGNHYVVAIVDCSKSTPSILNKGLIELDGVECCEEEMEHLDFEIDESLLNRSTNMVADEPEMSLSQSNNLDEDPDLNLSDLEFKEEDLNGLMGEDEEDDGLADFDICGLDELAESFKKQNGKLVEELAKQMTAPALAPQPQTKNVQNNQEAHITKENGGRMAEQVDAIKEDGDSDWEVEQEYVGRSVLPVLCRARPPTTKWLEDLYYVWIKVCITGVEAYYLRWTCDRFQFSASMNGRKWHIDEQLRGAIVPSCVTSTIKGFCVEIKMRKAVSGMEWGRLLFPNRKFAWVMRDLEAIDLNSSDSEGEDTLKHLNREIRKIPVKLRHQPLNKFEKNPNIKVDLESDSDSNCEYVDSDEMF